MKRTKVHSILCSAALLLPVFAGSSIAVAQSTVSCSLPCGETIGNIYGIQADVTRNSGDYSVRDEAFGKMTELGASSVRMPMGWDNLLRNGKYMYDIYDAAARSGQSTPLELIGSFTIAHSKEINALSQPELYARYIQELTSRYRTYFTTWETPFGVDSFRYGGMPVNHFQYIAILKGIQRTVKRNCPSASILLGAMANQRASFVDSLYANGASKYFDILGITVRDTPERIPSQVRRLVKQMEKYGIDKPVWISSATCSSIESPNFKDPEMNQATVLARTYLIAAATGIEKVFWNNLRALEKDPAKDVFYNGLYHPSFTPKPSAKAFETIVQMMPVGSKRPEIQISDGVWLASWTTPQGEKCWAVWTQTDIIPANIKIGGKAKFFDCTGGKMKLKALENAGPELIYIQGASSVEFN